MMMKSSGLAFLLFAFVSCQQSTAPTSSEIYQIVFVSSDGSPHGAIGISNSDGSGYKKIPLPDSVSQPTFPLFSPDGSTILFYASVNSNNDLFTIGSDGSGLRNITSNPAWDDHPAWFPDGNTIAFRSNRSGKFSIWLCNADGTNPRRCVDDSTNTWWPAISPDGSRIAFVYLSSAARLTIVGADGLNMKVLTPDSLDVSDQLSWSPDGTRILFTASSQISAAQYLCTADISGLSLRVVVSDQSLARGYWSPASTGLAMYESGGGLTLLRVDTGVSTPIPLDDDGIVTNPRWSPDGAMICFAASSPSKIFVVRSDGSGVRQLTTSSETETYPSWGKRRM